MNNKKREKLKQAREYIGRGLSIISIVLDDEQDCLDNFPENLQSSEKYDKFESTIETLEEAIEYIEKAIDSIENAEA